MKKELFYTILILCFTLPMVGQNYSGRVLDKNQNPISCAEIMLLTKDTLFISGTVADEKGDYTISEKDNGTLLKISSIGYKSKYLSLSGNTNNIILDEDEKELSEITITGERPKLFLGKEGMITQVYGTALSKIGTAGDLLSHLPNIVETDGTYSVFGRQGNPSIYINGKIVRNNKELHMLKSADIQFVEVIYSPSAKYSATVNSIIRIKTRKPTGDGLSGSLESQISQAHKLSSYEEIDINYRHKGLDLSVDLLHEHSNKYQYQTSMMNIPNVANRSLDGHITSCIKDWYGLFRTNYLFNEKHCIGITYEIEKQPLNGCANFTSDVIKQSPIVENYLYNSLIDVTKGNDHSVGIYYNGMLGKLSIDLNSDYLYRPQDITHNIFITESSTSRKVSSYNVESNRLLATKLNMSYPINKNQLSWGYEQTNTKRKDKYSNVGGIESMSDCNIREDSYSGYAEYDFNVRNFSTSVGLRYEYTHANYMQLNMEGNISKDYHGIYPNISLLYSAKSFMSRIMFSIKTQRPNYGNLSADRQYDDDYLYEGGNPYLLPSKTTNVAFESKYKYFFMGASFSYITDDIMLFDQLYGDKAALLTYINIPNRKKINLNFGMYKTIGIWTPNYSIAMDKQFLNVNTLEPLCNNNPIWMVKFNNHLELPFDVGFDVDFLYISKGANFNIISRDRNRVYVSLQKSFLKGNLDVKLKADDIFKGFYNKFNYYGASIYFDKNNYSDTRNISITVSYSFNATDSKYKGIGAGNAEKSRF